ncbi:hypothetical protein SAMN02745121_08902 [Nannocystis exedens]|uniref:Uncharacterized protein n=1 Tax=Nannocystis exedens TaxID=54 RepID=A0A1I2IQF1_9BACT|nr:hypothetical protein [Nannocystis exedens]PCC69275.1 hypothetical protein NAEX_02297 [Nannocystis exedens]SFF44535.1 hypothetical protein SAMN02745121_08902 [Nannocystis exedens]
MANEHALARDIRLLKIYALASTVVTIALAVTVLRCREQQHIARLAVERLDIVEPDGKAGYVLANRARVPNPVLDGKELERHGLPFNSMIFFNDRGDENGGLYFDSKTEPDGKYVAAAGLKFDQYRGDQIIGMTYDEENGKLEAGFRVWEHKLSGSEYHRLLDAAKAMPPGPARDAKIEEVRMQWGEERLFLGRHADGVAELVIADRDGHPRIRLAVDDAGHPRIELLDAQGRVLKAIDGTEPSGHGGTAH